MDPPATDAAAPRSAQPYRERLLAGMAELCAAEPRTREPERRDRLGQVFLRVLAGADAETRRRFALRVAEADWVSPDLALSLAGDPPETAAPVIAASPALGEPELGFVLERGGPEHRAAVARRADLSPRTAQAVLDTGEPLALAALAGAGAALPTPVLRALVDASHDLVALRAPLSRRSDLGAPLARRLSAWVGPDLRAELARRFALDGAGDGAGGTARSDDVALGGGEARLVAKLEAAGRLRPGFLLRTLREGRLPVFAAGLAALGGFTPGEVRAALDADAPDLLALACAAVGVDRSVAPSLVDLVRGLNDGRPGGGPPPSPPRSAAEAGAEFRAQAAAS